MAYGRASSTMLNGVSVARRTRVNPASERTALSRFSPAWPKGEPDLLAERTGVQTIVEKP
jgi:hypothetical protein